MLKVWTDKKDLDNIKWSYLEYFYYYFGMIKKESMSHLADERKLLENNKYFELIDEIEKCDIIIPMHSGEVLYRNYKKIYDNYILLSMKYNKPLLLETKNDYPLSLQGKNNIILKHSIYKFEKKENEIVFPAPIEDIGQQYINVRKKPLIPTVGFVGFASFPNLKTKYKTYLSNLKFILKSFIDNKSKSKIRGLSYRIKIINLLNKCDRINSNFIIRNKFGGNQKTISNFKQQRKEYINHLASSDYILCIKGDGNFSLRFYETLSMGKIPILIDTEVVMPLDDIIDYNQFCLVIDYRDIDNICDIVYKFHANLSDEDFKRMQKLSREIFENYLQINVFYSIFFKNILPGIIKKRGVNYEK